MIEFINDGVCPPPAFINDGSSEGAIKGWITRRGGVLMSVNNDDLKKLKQKSAGITGTDKRKAIEHGIFAQSHAQYREDRLKEASKYEQGSQIRRSLEQEAAMHHQAAMAHTEIASKYQGNKEPVQTNSKSLFPKPKSRTRKSASAPKGFKNTLKKGLVRVGKDVAKEMPGRLLTEAIIAGGAAALGALVISKNKKGDATRSNAQPVTEAKAP